ncbi:MAG: ROK family protein, partial [Planctomycetaceae bacterium]|nr:ROK family protein [Planctomycetaceae bacterium]
MPDVTECVQRYNTPTMKKQNDGQQRLYLGVDIGGTKVQASLVRESGEIIGRERAMTPRKGGPERVVAALEKCIADALEKGGISSQDLTAIGIAVPGVVDPDKGLVVLTPNMRLTGVALGPLLKARLKVPIVIGNDGNFGALGETWLGSARKAKSVLYICVGTGIGSGFVQRGQLWRGDRESAGEIGHIIMQLAGPKCGCGNRGCFEALASRTAIERDLREAIAAGRKSVLNELAGGNLSVIRSGMIRKALEVEDELVTEIVRRAAEVLGYACVSVRHLLDPEAIVLGGGVIEACSDFIMPIVENIVGLDPLPGAREGGRVLLSALGDDAVVLGAVAAARTLAGRTPFKKKYHVKPTYKQLGRVSFGEIVVGKKTYGRDIYVMVGGRVKKRKKKLARESSGSAHKVGPKELELVCQGGPEVLFIGSGMSGKVELTDDGQRYLAQRVIQCELLPTAKAADAYNRSKLRKAALMHVTC